MQSLFLVRTYLQAGNLTPWQPKSSDEDAFVKNECDCAAREGTCSNTWALPTPQKTGATNELERWESLSKATGTKVHHHGHMNKAVPAGFMLPGVKEEGTGFFEKQYNPLSGAVIAFDEVQKIQERTTGKSKWSLLRLKKACAHAVPETVVAGFSATPVVHGPDDLRQEINMLRSSCQRDEEKVQSCYDAFMEAVKGNQPPVDEAGQLLQALVSPEDVNEVKNDVPLMDNWLTKDGALTEDSFRKMQGYVSVYDTAFDKVHYPSFKLNPEVPFPVPVYVTAVMDGPALKRYNSVNTLKTDSRVCLDQSLQPDVQTLQPPVPAQQTTKKVADVPLVWVERKKVHGFRRLNAFSLGDFRGKKVVFNLQSDVGTQIAHERQMGTPASPATIESVTWVKPGKKQLRLTLEDCVFVTFHRSGATPTPTVSVEKMKVAELRRELGKRGLNAKGQKAELKARLQEALAEHAQQVDVEVFEEVKGAGDEARWADAHGQWTIETDQNGSVTVRQFYEPGTEVEFWFEGGGDDGYGADWYNAVVEQDLGNGRIKAYEPHDNTRLPELSRWDGELLKNVWRVSALDVPRTGTFTHDLTIGKARSFYAAALDVRSSRSAADDNPPWEKMAPLKPRVAAIPVEKGEWEGVQVQLRGANAVVPRTWCKGAPLTFKFPGKTNPVIVPETPKKTKEEERVPTWSSAGAPAATYELVNRDQLIPALYRRCDDAGPTFATLQKATLSSTSVKTHMRGVKKKEDSGWHLIRRFRHFGKQYSQEEDDWFNLKDALGTGPVQKAFIDPSIPAGDDANSRVLRACTPEECEEASGALVGGANTRSSQRPKSPIARHSKQVRALPGHSCTRRASLPCGQQ